MIRDNSKGVSIAIIFMGSATFLALAFMSFWFAKERIIFADMAFQEVYVLCAKKPLYNWARLGSSLLQFVPLLAFKMQASLATIIQVHSVAFIFYYFLGFCFIFFYQKQTKIAFAFALYLVFVTTDSFYWCQSEYQQGMMYLAIFTAYLFHFKSTKKPFDIQFWTLSLLQLVVIFSFHPLIIFPTVFIVVYAIGYERLLKKKNLISFSVVLFLGILSRIIMSVISPYETGKLSILGSVKKNLLNIFSLDSTTSFISSSVYLPYIILSIVCALYFLRSKAFVKLIIFVLFHVSYLALILLTHPDKVNYYSESMLLPLGFVTAVVFIQEFMPSKPIFVLSIVAFIMVIKLNSIYQHSELFTDRLAYLSSQIDKYTSADNPKTLLNAVNVDENKLMTLWATGYESLLISAMDHPANARVLLIDKDIEPLTWIWGNDSTYLSSMSIFQPSEMPKRIFQLKKKEYQFIR